MGSTFNPNKNVPQLKKLGKSDTKKPGEQGEGKHLTTPEAAVQVIKAEGVNGDKVALACFSVSNFGVFASSEEAVGLFVTGAGVAAQFEGSIEVTGDCEVTGAMHNRGDYSCDGKVHIGGTLTVDGDIQLSGRDYAEDFEMAGAAEAEPGTVMVLDDSGGIRISDQAYDRRVAGVVSGAGDCKPAVILGRDGSATKRCTVALMGKVYCRVDASEGPIAIGDLLTTSDTPGHAMKAANPGQAFGAVIGKALRPLAEGRGLADPGGTAMTSLRDSIDTLKKYSRSNALNLSDVYKFLLMERPLTVGEIIDKIQSLPESIPFHANIVTDVAMGGEVSLTLNRNGSYRFNGSMKAGGAFSFSFRVGVVVRSVSGQVSLTVQHTGKVFGTDTPGDRQDDWDEIHNEFTPTAAPAAQPLARPRR